VTPIASSATAPAATKAVTAWWCGPSRERVTAREQRTTERAVIDIGSVTRHVAAVRARIEAAGGHNVTLVAVTKGFGADAVEAAAAAGCTDVGENYAQELLAKLPDVHRARPRVHFIGRLQSNKVKLLSSVVDVWQSVDRSSLVAPLARHAPGAHVLVQVNISGERQKGGCEPEDTDALVDALRGAGLTVDGLMGVGPLGEPENARAGFRSLRSMVDELGLSVCSMGMTDDLEVAVEEGATMVRVGSALFGPRPKPSRGAH
jgi:pyridoxal phosphate enzyme (YggS family)